MLDENKWLAARHGLDGELVDLPERRTRARPRRWPGASTTGCASTRRTSARRTSSRGSSTCSSAATAPHRQRVVYEANHDFSELVRDIVAATASRTASGRTVTRCDPSGGRASSAVTGSGPTCSSSARPAGERCRRTSPSARTAATGCASARRSSSGRRRRSRRGAAKNGQAAAGRGWGACGRARSPASAPTGSRGRTIALVLASMRRHGRRAAPALYSSTTSRSRGQLTDEPWRAAARPCSSTADTAYEVVVLGGGRSCSAGCSSAGTAGGRRCWSSSPAAPAGVARGHVAIGPSVAVVGGNARRLALLARLGRARPARAPRRDARPSATCSAWRVIACRAACCCRCAVTEAEPAWPASLGGVIGLVLGVRARAAARALACALVPASRRLLRRGGRGRGRGARRTRAALDEAQRVVAQQAPALQRILDQALEDADWFGSAHQAEVLRAAGTADPDARLAAVRTLIAEETRVAHADRRRRRARARPNLLRNSTRRNDMDIRFLGHSAFALYATARRHARRPVPDRATRRPPSSADERRTPTRSCSPTATPTTSATPSRSRSAPARRSSRSSSSRNELGRAGRRERPRPEPRRHRRVRLGLGQAGAGLAHLDDAEGHRLHARGPADQVRRPDRLPPRRHVPVQRPAADRARGDQVDVALVPIGGHYTMDRHDAVTAVEFVGADAR